MNIGQDLNRKYVARFFLFLLTILLWSPVPAHAVPAKTVDPTAPLKQADLPALRRAIEDLATSFPDRYPNAGAFLGRLKALEQQQAAIEQALARRDATAAQQAQALAGEAARLRSEALLANPLLDFDKLLVVKRASGSVEVVELDRKTKKSQKKSVGRNLGLPQNWQGNCALPRKGYENEIAVLSPVRPEGRFTTLYKPDGGKFVGDVCLNFDADKMMFSSIGAQDRWHIFEISADGRDPRQLTPTEPDVDNYYPCYLADGRIIFGSTACFHGVPCVGGGNTVANLYRMDADRTNIRRLCFDQDHNWYPAVANDGRVIYTRWEYSDTPHYFSRILFRMNPDGTGQMEYYASNSYWPNSIFYARPIPGEPAKVVAVISGHHGVARMGELVIFDPDKARHEASGAVQRIPGYGKPVEPIIRDALVNDSWPKFLHPYPLSAKYFLVSMQPTPQSSWGIYLVDVFDNMVLVREEPGYALFEPVPFRKTARPPVIPDRVDLASHQATLYLTDIYAGPGLVGVPRGTVKKLRIYEPHYAYPHMGGHINIGVDGPWDARRIHGTVPVEADGSAAFKVPANVPLAIQPLDAEGKALQVMRSWYAGMPGERLSCVGCHERQTDSPPAKPTMASRKPPVEITPWYGPARGFSFKREVQPVLDKYCVGCHDGQSGASFQLANATDSQAGSLRHMPDFRSDQALGIITRKRGGGFNFDASYLALHPYVRRPGPESDYHLQVPLEWHADTSELVQMLKKGHHGVELDSEAWDRLITWIDLNVPDHGTWSEHRQIAGNFHDRRQQLNAKYANRTDDPEVYPDIKREPVQFVKPAPEPERKGGEIKISGWPFDTAEAKKQQDTVGLPTRQKIELAQGVALDLALIPAGQFVIGDANGCADEWPASAVTVAKPFYIGVFEITNEQFAQFDPAHDSAYISVSNKDQNTRGEPVNRPKQPVLRVSWPRAMAFCEWLTKKTGRKFTLPTEAQWEWACRAGTSSPLNFGDLAADFSKLANLADKRVADLCKRDSPKWIPHIESVNDGAVVTSDVGRYAPNAWGLHDMHGNAAEWTLTTCKPYPYNTADGRDAGIDDGPKVVRGGSFYDRLERARSGFRLSFPSWQRVYSVGFRVVCEATAGAKAVAQVTDAR